jgi:hypothetical protein
VLVGVLLVAFFVVKGCQDRQVRLSKEQAIATAEQQIDFKPETTIVRLLRQGLDRHPFWIVSLSIPIGDAPNAQRFKQLAVVRIDATTGKVASVQEQDRKNGGQGGSDGGRAKN